VRSFVALLKERASCGNASAAELAALLSAASPGRQEALWGELHGMRAAALFVAGAQDAKFGALARRMAGLVAGAPDSAAPSAHSGLMHSQQILVRIVEGCGHAVHIERPEALALALSRFIAAAAAQENLHW
jgi:pimeloyl-ACP methyl ester carboxylesterase